jgi:hypothetical protein
MTGESLHIAAVSAPVNGSVGARPSATGIRRRPSVAQQAAPTLSLPAGLIERLLREEIAALLPSREDLQRLRLELVLTVATMSSHEAGRCLGISGRQFRLKFDGKVGRIAIGYRSARYRVAEISSRLDDLAVACSADREAARAKFAAEARRIAAEIEQLAPSREETHP